MLAGQEGDPVNEEGGKSEAWREYWVQTQSCFRQKVNKKYQALKPSCSADRRTLVCREHQMQRLSNVKPFESTCVTTGKGAPEDPSSLAL